MSLINSQSTPLKYPLNDFFRHHTSVTFTQLKEETKEDGTVASTTRGTRSCSLFIPKDGFTVTDNAKYSGGGIGAIGQFIVEGDTAIEAANRAQEIGKGFGTGVTDILNTGMADLSDASAAVLTKLIQRARQQDTAVGRAARSAARITANPHLRSVFDSVDLRSFSYEFDLVPTNRQEAQMINKIVRFFRENLYPETIGVAGAPSISYRFPSKFDISYHFKGKRIAHKIKPCYLTRVKTVFNNQGQGMYYDGEFVSTRISLSFQEETTLSRKDVAVDVADGLPTNEVGY